MVSYRRSLASILALMPLLTAAQAYAQDATTNQVKKEATDIKVVDAPPPNGVFASLKADATFSFTDSQRVVGQPDGTTMNLGVKLDGHADVIEDAHEWRNSVLVNAGVTKTPAIQGFVKNTDILSVESIYLYHVRPWIGPFARARMDAPMFAGTDVRPTPTNFIKKSQDGQIEQSCDPDSTAPCTTTRFPLTDGFQPLTLKQSVGLFAQPHKSVPISIEARVGLGAQEILADKQYAVIDVPDTVESCPGPLDADTGARAQSTVPCIEISQLSDVMQLGVEANLEVWGSVYDNKISYKVYGGILAPFVHGPLPKLYTDSGGKDKVSQLTNIDFGANINFKLVEWASFGYELKAVRVPALLPDTFQVRNTFFLTVGLAVDNQPPPPAPPVAP
jgi:hypothetical protein